MATTPGLPEDLNSTSREHAPRSEWDARFHGQPLVWAETVRGADGIIAGFLTFNGEMWRADALLFDGLCYSESCVGYYPDQASATQGVLEACKRPTDHPFAPAS